MKNLYYIIWVDALYKLKSRPANRLMWKFYGFTFISVAMSLNLALLLAIIQRNIIGIYFYKLKIDVFPGDKIDSFFSFFILYLMLPMLINYLLIFKNKRYEKLFIDYGKYLKPNGKIAVIYLMISYFLPIVLIMIGLLITYLKK